MDSSATLQTQTSKPLPGKPRRVLSMLGRRSPLPGLLVILAAGMLVRGILYRVPNLGDQDAKRFVAQAEQILQQGQYVDCHLPPGYPAFLAGFFSLSPSYEVLGFLQTLLSLLAIAGLFLAARTHCPTRGFWAALLIAVNPWIAVKGWYLMSESLSAPLAIAVLGLALRLEGPFKQDRYRSLSAMAFAGLGTALVLVAPAAVFLVLFLGLYEAWKHRRQPWALAGLALGLLAVMGPWQAHVYKTKGVLAPGILLASPNIGEQGKQVTAWQNSFQVWPNPPYRSAYGIFVWDREDISLADLPAKAFKDPSEKALLEQQLATWRKNGEPYAPGRDNFFRNLAQERIAQAPFRYYLLMPLLRSCALWLAMPQVSHAQWEYCFRFGRWKEDLKDLGRDHALLRRAKTYVSLAMLAVHAFYVLLFAAAMIGLLLKGMPGWLRAAVLGAAAYTLLSSFIGLNEMRRNLPFMPFLITAAIFVPGIASRLPTWPSPHSENSAAKT